MARILFPFQSHSRHRCHHWCLRTVSPWRTLQGSKQDGFCIKVLPMVFSQHHICVTIEEIIKAIRFTTSQLAWSDCCQRLVQLPRRLRCKKAAYKIWMRGWQATAMRSKISTQLFRVSARKIDFNQDLMDPSKMSFGVYIPTFTAGVGCSPIRCIIITQAYDRKFAARKYRVKTTAGNSCGTCFKYTKSSTQVTSWIPDVKACQCIVQLYLFLLAREPCPRTFTQPGFTKRCFQIFWFWV